MDKVPRCRLLPKVVRVQLDGTLQFQSILPAYNKYVGCVYCDQVRKTYGFDSWKGTA